MKIITKSSNETIAFGKKFAKTLKGGEVLLLIGDLGSGKTTFAKGVAEGLGVKEIVNSPTFVIMKIYKAQSTKLKASAAQSCRQAALRCQNKLKTKNLKFKIKQTENEIIQLIHIDTYRGIDIIGLGNIGLLTQMLQQAGALEYFGREDSVCLVEWGAGLEEYLKKKKIKTIIIKIGIEGADKRIFNIK
ncbi:MAG: tRNA (adenosine(37)-N6)-threonylcarbamoyltransferase complex ATPase subunit type 1 TsaE [Parcubacteria group bacterium]